MANRYDEDAPQEFHFGNWSTSSDSGSQYDSDSICPISLNDLVNVDEKENLSELEETDFFVPSLEKAIKKSKEQLNKESDEDDDNDEVNDQKDFDLLNKDFIFPNDFSQTATVLGLDSTVEFNDEDDSNAKKDDEASTDIESPNSFIKNNKHLLNVNLNEFLSDSSSSSKEEEVDVIDLTEQDSDSSNEEDIEKSTSLQNHRMKSQFPSVNNSKESIKQSINKKSSEKKESSELVSGQSFNSQINQR